MYSINSVKKNIFRKGIRLSGFSDFLIAILFLSIALTIHCSSDSIAGGETRNERTITAYLPDGKTGAANTIVTIGSSKNDSIYFKGITDPTGVIEIPRLKEGIYSVYFEKEITDSTKFVDIQDSVIISQNNHNVQNDTLKVPGRIKGVVRFPIYDNSPENLRKVTVHILGTLKYANVDDSGNYKFTDIAAGAKYNLKLSPNKAGYTELYIDTIFPSSASLIRFDTIHFRLDTLAPINIKSLKFDSLSGVVTLSWDSARGAQYYTVYRLPMGSSQNVFLPQPAGSTTETIFHDTIFSLNNSQYRHSLYDTALYKYTYRIEFANSRGERNIVYNNPKDTITVTSPFRFHTSFNHILFDSLTNAPISNAVTGRTFGVIYTLSNNTVGVKSRKYTNSADSIEIMRQSEHPSGLIRDTLYFRYTAPGKVSIAAEILDSTSIGQPFNRDTFQINVYDIDLAITNVTIDPQTPVAGKNCTISVEIESKGLNQVKNTQLKISCYLDSQLIVSKNQPVDLIDPGHPLIVRFDTSAFSKNVLLTSGKHKLTTIVRGPDSLIEADTGNNVRKLDFQISDVDLKILDVISNPASIFDGNEVQFGAIIENAGSTDFIPDRLLKVNFNIENNNLFIGFLDDTIKAHSSDTIWSVDGNDHQRSWKATAGNYKLITTIDPDSILSESNRTNNSSNKNFFVNDFNLKIDSLNAQMNDSLDTISISMKVTKSGNIQSDSLNKTIDSVKIDLSINDTIDSTISIPINSPLPNNIIHISFPKYINILKYTSDLIIKAEINRQKNVLETRFDDNSSTVIIKKQEFNVNGTMDSVIAGQGIYGWKSLTDSSTFASFSWDLPGERIDNSRTLSITNSQKTFSRWIFPLYNLKIGKKYIVSGKIRGYNIVAAKSDSKWPPVSIGFEEAGFTCGIWKTGSYDWTDIRGIIYLPDVLTDVALSLNLGFIRHNDQDNPASGTVIFDDIKLVTY